MFFKENFSNVEKFNLLMKRQVFFLTSILLQFLLIFMILLN